jgi:hypothetical protein
MRGRNLFMTLPVRRIVGGLGVLGHSSDHCQSSSPTFVDNLVDIVPRRP